MKKHIGYTLTVVFVILGIQIFLTDYMAELQIRLDVLVEAIAATWVYFAFVNDKKVDTFDFVSDFNFHFLSSEKLIDVEIEFESCYNLSRSMKFKEWLAKKDFSGDKGKEFRKVALYFHEKSMSVFRKYVDHDKSKIDKEYQKLVNYLVYHESFAPLILGETVNIKDVDDLFGYRFFIVMNNPFIQGIELGPEQCFYRGCIKLYKKWSIYRYIHGCIIPMSQWSLFDLHKFYEKKPNKCKVIRWIKIRCYLMRKEAFSKGADNLYWWEKIEDGRIVNVLESAQKQRK